MIYKALLVFLISLTSVLGLDAQNLNLDKYDIFLRDTLISKSDFIKNGKNLDSLQVKYLTFKPIADGQKKIYFLTRQLSAQGEIKNKKENGFWTYWHENGQKAREGSFEEGKRTGEHIYWYTNGNLRGVGNFKNDKYDGKWIMYNEDGSEKTEQFYKGGELVK